MFEAVEVVKLRRGLLSAVAIAALVVLGCGGSSGQGGGTAGGGSTASGGGAAGGGGMGGGPYGGDTPGARLTLSSKPALGEYLVSPSDRALYYFALDVPGAAGNAPVSNCTGGCLSVWPIFNIDTPVAPAGLSSSDFKQFVRSDGATQTTYKGWPLYYFAGDNAGGDTNGDNLGDPRPTDLWFVIKAPFYSALIMTKNGGPSSYLADPTGRALYVFPQDTVGTATTAPVSACTDTGGCLAAWPVFAAGSGTLPTGLDPAKLTTFTRPDGMKQSAFDGHPLYYFAGDTSPGATTGGGVDGFDFANPTAL